MSLRIAFDLDGVLADMDSELARQAVVLFGGRIARRLQEAAVAGLPRAAAERRSAEDPGSEEASDNGGPGQPPPLDALNLTARQQTRLWNHVTAIENFWETLDECEPGVVARLAAVAAERRWEVIFLTKRPASAGATAQVQTQRWLASRGFPLPSVFVVQRSRGQIAASLELDVVVDDRPENCLDVVVDSKARAVLVWRGDVPAVPLATRRLGIGVTPSVNQCLDTLIELDEAGGQPGLVDRVMRMLGLKEAVDA